MPLCYSPHHLICLPYCPLITEGTDSTLSVSNTAHIFCLWFLFTHCICALDFLLRLFCWELLEGIEKPQELWDANQWRPFMLQDVTGRLEFHICWHKIPLSLWWGEVGDTIDLPSPRIDWRWKRRNNVGTESWMEAYLDLRPSLWQIEPSHIPPPTQPSVGISGINRDERDQQEHKTRWRTCLFLGIKLMTNWMDTSGSHVWGTP